MPRAVHEAGRVLADGGVLCLAIVHPINSAGHFEGPDPKARFVIEDSYLEPHQYVESIERDGLPMTFTSRHWPLQSYFAALHDAGFTVDALKEVTVNKPSAADAGIGDHWWRVPLFLDLRARKR